MKSIILVLLILTSCKSAVPSKNFSDEFEKIFHLRQTRERRDLVPTLGEPERIDKSGPDSDEYYFPIKKDQMPIKVFVDKKSNKITGIALTYWVGFDAYAHLKKKFKDYKWIETPIPSKAVDVVEDIYKVEIPDLGITFQYDNQDPLRRPMWIFFR